MSAKTSPPAKMILSLVFGGPVTLGQHQGKFLLRPATPAEYAHPIAKMMQADPLLDVVCTMSGKRGLSVEWRRQTLNEAAEALSAVPCPFTVQL